MSFTSQYLEETAEIVRRLDPMAIDQMVAILAKTRAQQGRLFILGVGGSAANASHAVNDFRKITGIEAYAPTDNVSELTARTNDEGWAGKGAWAGRQRWWLYGYRGGCLRGCANGESTSCHPAFRGLSGRDLAPAGSHPDLKQVETKWESLR